MRWSELKVFTSLWENMIGSERREALDRGYAALRDVSVLDGQEPFDVDLSKGLMDHSHDVRRMFAKGMHIMYPERFNAEQCRVDRPGYRNLEQYEQEYVRRFCAAANGEFQAKTGQCRFGQSVEDRCWTREQPPSFFDQPTAKEEVVYDLLWTTLHGTQVWKNALREGIKHYGGLTSDQMKAIKAVDPGALDRFWKSAFVHGMHAVYPEVFDAEACTLQHPGLEDDLEYEETWNDVCENVLEGTIPESGHCRW